MSRTPRPAPGSGTCTPSTPESSTPTRSSAAEPSPRPSSVATSTRVRVSAFVPAVTLGHPHAEDTGLGQGLDPLAREDAGSPPTRPRASAAPAQVRTRAEPAALAPEHRSPAPYPPIAARAYKFYCRRSHPRDPLAHIADCEISCRLPSARGLFCAVRAVFRRTVHAAMITYGPCGRPRHVRDVSQHLRHRRALRPGPVTRQRPTETPDQLGNPGGACVSGDGPTRWVRKPCHCPNRRNWHVTCS